MSDISLPTEQKASKNMDNTQQQYPSWLNNFITTYEGLSTDNVDLIVNVYHQNVTFIDPMHELKGLTNLTTYFEKLYQNISSCSFKIQNVLHESNNAAIYWTMTYQHTKLNQGLPISVEGSSFIKSEDNKVIYHRDYLDLGIMVYEQIPLLGKLIKFIKAKASK